MKNWLIKSGLFKSVLLITILSIAASVLITVVASTLAGREFNYSSILISILVPSIISPIVTTYIINMVLTNHQLRVEMQTLAEELQRSNDAKSDFLASMSHEIRTPLNGALSMITLLSRTDLTEKQREYVDAINFSSETLLTLISDVLDLSIIESGKLQLERTDFELTPILENMVTLFQPKAITQNDSLTYHVDKKIPRVLIGDPTRLRQLLFNLIGNALKFTTNGEVRVKVTQIDESKNKNRVSLLFEVVDSGIGIREEIKPKLFKPFTQADSSINRRFGGSGLGLAICHHIIEAMDGEIDVDSHDGEGSEFWFKIQLPYTSSESSADTISSDNIIKKDISLNILLVEDDPINQRAESALLEQDGHHVVLAKDGYVALEILEKCQEDTLSPFDIILMDIRMPGINGMDTTLKIREMAEPIGTLPIIALTADITQQNISQCIASGMDSVISKPIRYDELREQLSLIKVKK
ncbi:MAG: ATP-binding protein [Chromatiales bacterium]|nr:ATP-binding protein [Chromatiales bacterium]